MRRLIAFLTAACCLLTLTPAAQATPDPVAALKKQFRAGYGVRFTMSETGNAGGTTTRGRFQLSRAGWYATDLTRTSGKEKLRVITIGRDVYLSASRLLPEGEGWLHAKATMDTIDPYSPVIDNFEPGTLRALLGSATTRSPHTYAGRLTLARLAEISRRASGLYGPLFVKAAGKELIMSWKIWTGSDGLVRRVRVTTSSRGGSLGASSTSDVRYLGWGSRVDIRHPDPLTVAELEDQLPATS